MCLPRLLLLATLLVLIPGRLRAAAPLEALDLLLVQTLEAALVLIPGPALAQTPALGTEPVSRPRLKYLSFSGQEEGVGVIDLISRLLHPSLGFAFPSIIISSFGLGW